jgi:metallo-beta-lactamase family protein
VFLVHGEEPALRGLSDRIAERTVPAAQIIMPLLDDIYELTTTAPTPLDVSHHRRLAPEAVVNLDWHNDMSKLILDIDAARGRGGRPRARRNPAPTEKGIRQSRVLKCACRLSREDELSLPLAPM